MSTIMFKNSLSEDLLACRTCLATERKLYSIHIYNISEAYKFLTGNEASPFDGLPQYICNYCGVLLLKFNTFRRNSQQAQNYFEDTKIIPQDLITSYHPVLLKKTKVNIIDSTKIETIEPKADESEINDIDPQDFDYQTDFSENIQNVDSKIYADIIKIESTSKSSEPNSKRTKTNSKSCNTDSKSRRGKYFETDENMRDFESAYNVDVVILSREQQIKDVSERKLSSNYLNSPYKCELCFKGVMDEDSLNKHMLYQHDPSRGSIICEFCSFRYKDRRGLNQHLKSHRLKFICKQCPYVSRTTFNAKEHYKMHTGHIHECRHCGKSYEKLSSHLTHLRLQHPSHFIWCDICGEAFIGQFGLNAHKKRAHRHLNLPFACPSCPAKFSTESAVKNHNTNKLCSKIYCIQCGEDFTKEMELREHLLEKHRSCKEYQCEKCSKSFTRQSLYYAHYRRAHVDSKDKVGKQKSWICEICGKTLPNKCVLLYHQRNHTGERPYQCAQCNKSFTMRKLLQSHLRVHTSDRPYACKLCPKTFKGLSALRAHENVHTGTQKGSKKT